MFFFPSGQLGISLTATFGSIIMTARPLGAIGLKGYLAVRSEREKETKKFQHVCFVVLMAQWSKTWKNAI